MKKNSSPLSGGLAELLSARSKLLGQRSEKQPAKESVRPTKVVQVAPKPKPKGFLLPEAAKTSRVAVRADGAEVAGPVPWTPEPYQIEGVKFLLEHACAALLLDPGWRKTSMVLAAFKMLKKAGHVDRMLVVAPPRVCKGVWPAEVAKWSDFAGLKTVWLHGLKKEHLLDAEADIFLVNFEGLEWLFNVTKTKSPKTGKVSIKVNLDRFKKLRVGMLAVDEISKLRKATSQRSRIIAEVRNKFDRIVGMTGSPTPRSLMDLFGVMLVVDGGYSLGSYITHYRNAYFYPSGYGGFDWQLAPGSKEKIYERIAPFAFRPDASATIKLPQLVTNPVWIELPEEARGVYDELEEEFITLLLGPNGVENAIIANNAGSAYVKCCQVANGGLYLNRAIDAEGKLKRGTREWLDLHDEKTQAVVDLVEELSGKPALIVYDTAHDLARLQTALGKDFPHIGGGVTMSKGDKLVEAWNKGHLPGLLVHPASVAHGLNMQEGDAQHVIHHSITSDFELYDQIIRRLLRSGNRASHVFSHLIAAKDTVDEAKVKSLRKKDAQQQDLLSAMEAYTLARRRARRK